MPVLVELVVPAGSPPRMPRGARPGRRHRAPSSPARSGLGASSHQPGPRCARKPNRLRRWRLLGTTRSGDCRKRIRLRHPGIAARPGRLVVPSTISSMGDDDVDRPEPPSAKAVTALLREARSLSRRADKLNGTAAAVDDPTTQQLAAEACTTHGAAGAPPHAAGTSGTARRAVINSAPVERQRSALFVVAGIVGVA